MRISIRVKPNSKHELVEKTGDNEFVVRVNAPAKDGKANDAVIGALSDHFDIPKSRITIIKGGGSKQKLVDIA